MNRSFFDESKLLFNESKLFCSFNESLKLQSVLFLKMQGYLWIIWVKLAGILWIIGGEIRQLINILFCGYR